MLLRDVMRLTPPRSFSKVLPIDWPSLGLAVLLLVWGRVARLRSETWWWVAAIDLVPPQVVLPVLAWLLWHTRRRIWLLWNLVMISLFVVFQIGLIMNGAALIPTAQHISMLRLNTRFYLAEPLGRSGAARTSKHYRLARNPRPRW